MKKNKITTSHIAIDNEKTVESEKVQCSHQLCLANARGESAKAPTSKRTLHERRLKELWEKAQAASDRVVERPYRMQPTLGVTERERALFDYYEELFLWKDSQGGSIAN